MRGITSINEIADLEQCRTLVLITPDEHAIGIIAEDGSINHDGEAGRLGQILGVYGMEIVTSI